MDKQSGYRDEKLTNIRRLIANNVYESISKMAQVTNHSSFNATALLEYRKSFKERGQGITLNDIILFAVSRTLKKHPHLNAHFLDDKIRYFEDVNLGIAVDTERGLLVPTLFEADKKSLTEISAESKRLVESARSGRIDPELLANGTFTLTNLGKYGVESFSPIINPPQTAILGVCSVQVRFKEEDGKLIHYPAMGLSLTYDHRALDGATAAMFSKDLAIMLEVINSS
ncbi:MAG TPA: dihydrolipoamide acetyltransferase family protein, partial [Desulfitobacteriaceae bacterium]|nr:dihydrolipoamide acetyltransferase family protein [Desulfitobacteriaceae bacterium]